MPQNELTPFYPRSPYGVAKVYGHWITVNYRESYGMFACSGILFNHESPRRGRSSSPARSPTGSPGSSWASQDSCRWATSTRERDWGFAGDYVAAMWLMLQQPEPDDYVVADGVAHSVRDVCRLAFSRLGLDYERYVIRDERLFRPAEVDHLLGDPSKARSQLGWQPEVDFESLVNMMVDADLERLKSRIGASLRQAAGS